MASYTALMRAKAAQRQVDVEQQVALQHVAAEMNALAGIGKLPALNDYLDRFRPPRKRTVADMIRTLQDAAGRGAAIRIRERT